jgi:hypothetical protein
MSIVRSAEFMRALVRKNHATQAVNRIIHQNTATFEVEHKDKIEALFKDIYTTAENGQSYLTIEQTHPYVKYWRFKVYLEERGFQVDRDWVWWNPKSSE